MHPQIWADATCKFASEFKPDVFVLHKGWHHYENHARWSVPPYSLWWLRKMCARMVYMSFDDPAGAPITLGLDIVPPFDMWLTSCPGIADLFKIPKRCAVHEYWLAWDDRISQPIPVEPELEVDVAITGHPYHRPFPPPHWQHGFGTPRADLARAVLERGWNLGIWGPNTWLDREHGGDPLLGPWYRGWLDPSQVHRVHRSAKVTLATQLCEGRRYDAGRLPWTLGAGGCLAHEDRPGLREEFGGSVGWFRYGDLREAMEKVDFLLRHPHVRAEMSAEGQRIVLERHTWKVRAMRLVELVGG